MVNMSTQQTIGLVKNVDLANCRLDDIYLTLLLSKIMTTTNLVTFSSVFDRFGRWRVWVPVECLHRVARNSGNNSLKWSPFPCFFSEMVHKPIKLFAGVLWSVADLKLALFRLAAAVAVAVEAAQNKLTFFFVHAHLIPTTNKLFSKSPFHVIISP